MAGVELLGLGGEGSRGCQPVGLAANSPMWLISAGLPPGHGPSGVASAK